MGSGAPVNGVHFEVHLGGLLWAGVVQDGSRFGSRRQPQLRALALGAAEVLPADEHIPHRLR
jgi:hypothetical protein